MVRKPSGRRLLTDDQDREFFKVYLPRFSFRQLVIPPAFVRYLHGTIPKDIILKDTSGRQWHCRLEESEGGLAIKGWNSFAVELSLKAGDFLVFKYNGDCMFMVKIFGRNGCIKEGTLFPNLDLNHVKKETETEEEQTFRTPDHFYKRKSSRLAIRRTEKSGSSLGANPLKETKGDATDRVKSKTCNTGPYIIPKNPYFVSKVGKYFTYFSAALVQSHGIKLKSEITLCHESGAKWPVRITFSADGRMNITKGWINFYRENDLKVGDTCVFELICTARNVCSEIKVQVIRTDQKGP